MELRAKKCPAPLFRLVEAWLRAEFEKRQAEKKLNKGKKNDDPNNSAEILPKGGITRSLLFACACIDAAFYDSNSTGNDGSDSLARNSETVVEHVPSFVCVCVRA